MAEALYDIIAAGVPHRVLEIKADGFDLADLKLSWDRTVKLDHRAVDEILERFEFDATAESGPAARLAVALSFRDLNVGVIDLGSIPVSLRIPYQNRTAPIFHSAGNRQLGKMANACRLHFKARTGSTATAIHYGAVDSHAGKQSAMLVRASKVLCLEDRLWDVEGGAKFAAAAIDVALSAGRKVVLLCKDSDCVFRNRVSIRNLTENRIDFVVGEATTAQLLYDLERIDSLVQKFRMFSTGTLLWRHSLAPLVLEGNIIGPTDTGEMVDRTNFWNTFLPMRMGALIRTGTILNPAEQRWRQQGAAERS